MSSCRLLTSALFALAISFPAHAQEITAVKGAFFAQTASGGWQPLKAGAKAPTGKLLVSLFDTELRSPNGDVDILLHGGIGEFGPLPSFESAITLNENPKADLDVTLERGILVLTNNKKEGPANVELHMRGKALTVVLDEPGTKIGIDLYARHAPGLESLKADDPVVFLFAMVAKGSAHISHKDKTLALHAPPGPAMVRWNSATQVPEIEHLDKLPDWVTPTDAEKKATDKINEIAAKLGDANARGSWLKLLFSSDPIERKVGLTAIGALGTPAPLFVTLQKSKDADARQFAILVVRNWLGQDVKHLKRLEKAFDGLGLSKTDIESLLHLFVGFDEDERRHPATYQLLISGLGHSKQLVRELSYWHLTRLVPEGTTIAYDAAGTPAQFQTAIDRWRELIPPGQMPPAPKK